MPKVQKASPPTSLPWTAPVAGGEPFQVAPAPSVVKVKVEREQMVISEQFIPRHSEAFQLDGSYPLDPGVSSSKHMCAGVCVPLVMIKKEEEEEMETLQGMQLTSQSDDTLVLHRSSSLQTPIKCGAKHVSPPSEVQERKRARSNRGETTVRESTTKGEKYTSPVGDHGVQIPSAEMLVVKTAKSPENNREEMEDAVIVIEDDEEENLLPCSKLETALVSIDSERMQSFLMKLGLNQRRNRKLALEEMLEINSESLKVEAPRSLEDLPWHFLRNLMALNGTARNTNLVLKAEEDSWGGEEGDLGSEMFCLHERDTRISVNPLDVLSAILLCSDSFLQQEILLKMSMCQFALPLILPPLDTPKCTLMVWAMRDIVRKWRPHSLAESRGFREQSLVHISMPTISFVRMGSCSLSKSRLLNEVLSSPQQHHDFFVHRDMECGNVPREISDGLMEISWYFPGGRENSDLFPEPVALLNLRGDAGSHWMQFHFLTEISSAVFILVESLCETEYNKLLTLQGSASKFCIILNSEGRKSKNTLEYLNKLAPVLNMNKSQLLVKEKNQNNAELVRKLRLAMGSIMNLRLRIVDVVGMAVKSRFLGICVDEDEEECCLGSRLTMAITAEIKEVVNYKGNVLRLQGDLWKNIGKTEKELCRMKEQRDVHPEDYKSQLRKKLLKLRQEQNKYKLSNGMLKFINAVSHLPQTKKRYFLKWLKYRVDHVARGNLSKLQAEYKAKCHAAKEAAERLRELDQLIPASSLGVEHFMREMGQLYEAECSMIQEGKMSKRKRQFVLLPGVAAELLLEGFPMELVDGDASNIPLRWVSDVLTELHTKLGGRSKMQVLSVLGVQSTGKSTLLNTMFGLQFAVGSGRCTRGAFMTLLRVAKDLQQELGCNFVLVIDTEGLKAPELARLEDSYEHDNELATLVIGLSDITVVNLAMENATEMKDILQIVVHAFLRMKETGHKPSCQFVHQNVSDVSAHEQNMRDRKLLLEELNEMTKAAAKMENLCREVSFSDIMDYDPEKHNWYIPGLWHGVPPMAPINAGYSESVCDLKRYLFECMKHRSRSRAPNDIPQFIEWVRSLWNAVKHESFIFSFRNSLVAGAYNQLCVKYSEWEWDFRKEMHLWVSQAEMMIRNKWSDDLRADMSARLRVEAQQKLHEGEQKMASSLQGYFESKLENLHLIEKYREDFARSTTCLRMELECYVLAKCEEFLLIQKNRSKIERLQVEYMEIVKTKVDSLLADCRERAQKLQEEELEEEFEKMWARTIAELPLDRLPRRDVAQNMHYQLHKDLENRGSLVMQMLQQAQSLHNYQSGSFQMKKEYLELSVLQSIKEYFKNEYLQTVEELAISLMDQCRSYVTKKVQGKGDYDETFCRELLQQISEKLQEVSVKQLPTTASFEMDLKLHILGEASAAFEQMHQHFIMDNDPSQHLEKLKPHYLSTFKTIYYEKDECQKRAMDFCHRCLRPALLDYLHKRLGIIIVDDFLRSEQSIHYGSRSFFQFAVQKKLLEEMNFDDYVEYILNYKRFVQSWIQKSLLKHYREGKPLKNLVKEVLSAVLQKVNDTLLSLLHKGYSSTIGNFLDNFCQKLNGELVISKDGLDIILFRNMANVAQFAGDILTCLSEVEEEILRKMEENIEVTLSKLQVCPRDEIFKRVFGCGQQCPFCKVPCEAGGSNHKIHFASVHRPQGLNQMTCSVSIMLTYSICSSDVASWKKFRNRTTSWQWYFYKEYRRFYPNWHIQPDPSVRTSNYWKFIFKVFNLQFADKYNALPAVVPADWRKLSKKHALASIQEAFNVK
ncbi:interferon-induced very large GTPase 1-like [Hemicordylus capensis]|uniref:interferon-induced very large GTPase 1-like n=1 Tax=Hemicordylus capensis TaxID=884348 RepID=UPI002304C663|nr:interferon-induced very large GTPase 1-like [Hemicordylus capensis]XP_053114753.1 interferon-induced very large GTPase 1-like [Hemicordylus capensis]XP_053114754.1 interferon-induced very large GTPase 1-like [Hemicordylus capensis]XP_053114755.1 interferon-induced very large GTPase 1-like [Hemicordylus capensis]XP_053114756.1 interferon-induced very large GTPase 1-like [Hemicordylus capensis]